MTASDHAPQRPQRFPLPGGGREAELGGVESRLRALEDRMTHLEANQNQVIVEARSAASAASSTVAGVLISDLVTRLTRLEISAETLEKRLLPPE